MAMLMGMIRMRGMRAGERESRRRRRGMGRGRRTGRHIDISSSSWEHAGSMLGSILSDLGVSRAILEDILGSPRHSWGNLGPNNAL